MLVILSLFAIALAQRCCPPVPDQCLQPHDCKPCETTCRLSIETSATNLKVNGTKPTWRTEQLAMVLSAAAYAPSHETEDTYADSIQRDINTYMPGTKPPCWTTPDPSSGSIIWIGSIRDSLEFPEGMMYVYWVHGSASESPSSSFTASVSFSPAPSASTSPGVPGDPSTSTSPTVSSTASPQSSRAPGRIDGAVPPLLPPANSVANLFLVIRGTDLAGVFYDTHPQLTEFLIGDKLKPKIPCGFSRAARDLSLARDSRYTCNDGKRDCSLKGLLRYLNSDLNCTVNLVVTGHSLGGALASIMASHYVSDAGSYFKLQSVIPFAALTPGDENFQTWTKTHLPNVTYSYKNYFDLAPFLYTDFSMIVTRYYDNKPRINTCPCDVECYALACIQNCKTPNSTYVWPVIPGDIHPPHLPDSSHWLDNAEAMHSHIDYVTWMYNRPCA